MPMSSAIANSAAGCGSASSAAGRARSSARSTARRPGSTTCSRSSAGVLSSDPERSAAAAAASSAWRPSAPMPTGEHARRRARRPDGIDVVAIMTPNEQPPRALRARRSSRPRRDLRQAADHDPGRRARSRAPGAGERPVFCLTHNYTGLPHGPAGARHGPGRRRSARSGRSTSNYVQGHNASLVEGERAAASLALRPDQPAPP